MSRFLFGNGLIIQCCCFDRTGGPGEETIRFSCDHPRINALTSHEI